MVNCWCSVVARFLQNFAAPARLGYRMLLVAVIAIVLLLGRCAVQLLLTYLCLFLREHRRRSFTRNWMLLNYLRIILNQRLEFAGLHFALGTSIRDSRLVDREWFVVQIRHQWYLYLFSICRCCCIISSTRIWTHIRGCGSNLVWLGPVPRVVFCCLV